jgi:beta-1,4-N-acetylglucosaminyltransferase
MVKIYVQVGTTRFDALTSACLQQEFLKLLESYNCESLKMQCGNYKIPSSISISESSTYPLPKAPNASFPIELYRYKPSLDQDQSEADVIISHGGAGSVFESLLKKKKTLAVINQDLMDNHQLEMVQALQDADYLIMCENVQDLEKKFNELMERKKAFRELSPSQMKKFDELVQKELSKQTWMNTWGRWLIQGFFLLLIIVISWNNLLSNKKK